MGQNYIQADYDSLESICRAFEHSADSTAATTYLVHQCTQRLEAGGWTGLGAQAFFHELYETVLPAMERLESAFQTSADTVTRLAGIFRTAEEEAARLFQGIEAFLNGGTDGDSKGGGDNVRAKMEDPGGGSGKTGPVPATEDQIRRLEELGIELAPGETISRLDAAWLIRYMGETDGLLRGNPWTGANLHDAVQIMRRLDGLNFNLEQSSYVEGGWSIDELRQLDGVVDTMAENARLEFLERYSEDDLIRLAAYYGLPVSQAGYAPLLLALEDTDVNFQRDGNNNVNYILDGSGDVQYYPEGTFDPSGNSIAGRPVVWYSYLGADGVRHTHDVRSPLPEGATEWRQSLWYGRAEYADGDLIFGDRAFFADTNTNFSVGGSFSSDALISHEISHLIVGTTPGLADNFANLDGAGANGVDLDIYDTGGYTHNARSSNTGDEMVVDLITNGLMGTFPDTDAGSVRSTQFDSIIGDVFADNMPDIADYAVTPEYEAAVREALGFQPDPAQ